MQSIGFIGLSASERARERLREREKSSICGQSTKLKHSWASLMANSLKVVDTTQKQNRKQSKNCCFRNVSINEIYFHQCRIIWPNLWDFRRVINGNICILPGAAECIKGFAIKKCTSCNSNWMCLFTEKYLSIYLFCFYFISCALIKLTIPLACWERHFWSCFDQINNT